VPPPDSTQAPGVGEFERRFRAAIGDDLDVPVTMALISELVRSDLAPAAKADLLSDWDRVLGLALERGAQAPEAAELPDGAAELLEQRGRARSARDFATSDGLRDRLAAMGVRVIDTSEGQKWEVRPR
jgi:cysteinyl-tRNA synthetase